jgi:hypothetical protein
VSVLGSAFLGLLLVSGGRASAATVIYQTGFEPSEGYDANLDLVGQKGWVGAGSGGNGLTSGFFPGRGQQAYIGFTQTVAGAQALFVYQPLNQSPTQAQFSVTMAVIDSSTTTNRDDFLWSVYNQQGDQLFTIDFDNYALKVNYLLDGTNTQTWSGLTFTNSTAYPLVINLDFAGNRWSATFNGAVLATNQPITTIGSPLNLGDVDAVWQIYYTNAPGDNYLVFDDYLVTGTMPPPQLKVLGLIAKAPAIRLFGQPDSTFALEASSNLVNWVSWKTNVTVGGYFDFTDSGAIGLPRRFYRGRWAP